MTRLLCPHCGSGHVNTTYMPAENKLRRRCRECGRMWREEPSKGSNLDQLDALSIVMEEVVLREPAII